MMNSMAELLKELRSMLQWRQITQDQFDEAVASLLRKIDHG